jgi:endonuclease-3
MMEVVPREDWTDLGHMMIAHGRARCMARRPDCDNCEVEDLCPRIGVTETK